MSDFHDSHPFSHKWTGIRGSSGGLTLFKAFSEWYHNDRDSQKENTSGYSYTKSFFDSVTKTAYILHWSASSGISEIEHLFSLGNIIRKKGADKIGDKNHGHAAAVAFFNPTSMYSETKALTDSKYQSLNFKVKEFDERVEKMNTGEETDYRAISVKDYMVIKREKDMAQNEILTKIKNSIVDKEMKTDLESILESSKSSYMLHLMAFDQNHLYSVSLIDDQYMEMVKSISLYYCEILKENYSIKFEASSKPAKKPITYTADSSNAISPILEPETFHPINITCSMYEYKNKKTEEIYNFMRGEMRVEGRNRVFYLDHTKSEKKKEYRFANESKKEWDNAIEKGSFVLTLNCPSKDVFTKYSSRLGTDIKGIDEARGVLMSMFGCILGKPSWDKEYMSAQRNAGYFNIVIEMLSKNTANMYFGLKANKHNSDLSDSHPIIKYFVGKIHKDIVKYYTHCNLKTSETGIKTWDSDKVFKQLLEKSNTKNDANDVNHVNTDTGSKNVLNMMGVLSNNENTVLSENEETTSDNIDEGSVDDSLSNTTNNETLSQPAVAQAVAAPVPPVVAPAVAAPVAQVVAPVPPVVAPAVAAPVAQVVAPVPPVVGPVAQVVAPVAQVAAPVPPVVAPPVAPVVAQEQKTENSIKETLVFNQLDNGTLVMIDNSNVVYPILSVGYVGTLKTYLESVTDRKSIHYVKGLVDVMNKYIETH